jgi:hypothetical protein
LSLEHSAGLLCRSPQSAWGRRLSVHLPGPHNRPRNDPAVCAGSCEPRDPAIAGTHPAWGRQDSYTCSNTKGQSASPQVPAIGRGSEAPGWGAARWQSGDPGKDGKSQSPELAREWQVLVTLTDPQRQGGGGLRSSLARFPPLDSRSCSSLAGAVAAEADNWGGGAERRRLRQARVEERTRKLRLLEGVGGRVGARVRTGPPLQVPRVCPRPAQPRLSSGFSVCAVPGTCCPAPTEGALRSACTPPSSTFRIVRLRSTPRRSHLQWASACRVGWACVMGCPCGFSPHPPLIVQHALARVQQTVGVSLGLWAPGSLAWSSSLDKCVSKQLRL